MNPPDSPKPPEEESLSRSHKPDERHFSDDPVVFPEKEPGKKSPLPESDE